MGKKSRLLNAVICGRYEEVLSLLPPSDLSTGLLPTWTESYDLLVASLSHNHHRITALLLERGCVVSDRSVKKKFTPLHLAVAQGCGKDIIENIIKRGADMFALGRNGKRPFQFAIERGDPEVVELFINYGVDVNHASRYFRTKGKTSLHEAVELEKVDIVRTLLRRGASVNATCEYPCRLGFTPLHFAVFTNNCEIIKLLLDHGADINAGKNVCYSPIILACVNNRVDSVKFLIENGANLDPSKDELFGTILHVLVSSRSVSIIEMLLKSGIDPNSTDVDGNTALHIAAEGNVDEVAYVLIKAGTNINKQNNEGQTALHFCCYNDNMLLASLFLDAGADVNIQDTNGQSVLHLASMIAEPVLLVKLLLFGADINALDNNFQTPLDVAFQETETFGLTAELLVRYVIAFSTLGLKIINKNSSDPNFKAILSNLRDFESQCSNEIKLLQETKICKQSYVTYLDILTKPTSAMQKFLKNEGIHEALTDISDIDKRFPIYGCHIKKNYNDASLRKKLVDSGVTTFNEIFVCSNLPLTCIEDILSHLSNEELRIFSGLPSVIDELRSFNEYVNEYHVHDDDDDSDNSSCSISDFVNFFADNCSYLSDDSDFSMADIDFIDMILSDIL